MVERHRRENRGAQGTPRRSFPPQKQINLDLKYSTSDVFWALLAKFVLVFFTQHNTVESFRGFWNSETFAVNFSVSRHCCDCERAKSGMIDLDYLYLFLVSTSD